MAEMRGLGKGIRALIPETSNQRKEEVARVPLQTIQLSRFQPRKKLDEVEIQKLAESIRESGLIYPLLVRKTVSSGVNEPSYELIAGERRLRALRLLGETQVPVIVKDVSDRKSLELSLIENIQREGLNPMEEALAFHRLGQEFELTQEQIATAVGKDRATVANTLRLVKLSDPVREDIHRGNLSSGHARALLGLESPKDQEALARRIVAEGLSVRRVEQLVRLTSSGSLRARTRLTKDPHIAEAEQRLQKALGTKVEIHHGRTRGWIRIDYFSLKDLDRLIGRIS